MMRQLMDEETYQNEVVHLLSALKYPKLTLTVH